MEASWGRIREHHGGPPWGSTMGEHHGRVLWGATMGDHRGTRGPWASAMKEKLISNSTVGKSFTLGRRGGRHGEK